MVPVDGHPDISCSDWSSFRRGASPCLVEQVLDRNAIILPNWYLPLARGAAVASPYLLRRAGYRAGRHRARDWRKPTREELFKDLRTYCLIAIKCGNFWRIALDVNAYRRPHGYTNYALAHFFGSTPMLTRTYQEATYLAELCWPNEPPSGLCWVSECPDDMRGAIEFARQRRIGEAIAARTPGCSLPA
jgi:hypothetical protein